MSDQKSNPIDRRRRLLITLGAGVAGAYVAPTLVTVARAEPPHHGGHGGHHGHSGPSYSRPSGHHRHYSERRYYRDKHHYRRRHHDHHDSGMHFNILLHPSRW
ncbi:hypothetical protein [Guyparkeria sp. SCN-R1]|uniref:hypothetical protein n=1 Tax=Guyparkeria sp. SCN-R1 TaxID=2341113 RepID=UPI000F64655B|nr:hypothetical protein [Guyparkeria sp. SCN-R1]